MTTNLLPGNRNAYRLSDDLQETGGSRNVRPIKPNDRDREELILSKLGPRGWGRLHHFRNYYSAGWGEHSNKPLSPRALETFYRFLEQATFPTNTRPSLFLTDDGTLELCWEDLGGKAVQVEFTPSEIEFFQEASKREGVVIGAKAAEIAKELSVT